MSERKDQMQTECGLAETIGGTPIGEHVEPQVNGQQDGTDQKVGTRREALPPEAART